MAKLKKSINRTAKKRLFQVLTKHLSKLPADVAKKRMDNLDKLLSEDREANIRTKQKGRHRKLASPSSGRAH
jgi:hypothetical protein